MEHGAAQTRQSLPGHGDVECPQKHAPLPGTFPVEDVQHTVLHGARQLLHNVSLHWYSCTEWCLDISAGQTDNGNTVQLWKCYDEEMDQRVSIPVGGKGQMIWSPRRTTPSSSGTAGR